MFGVPRAHPAGGAAQRRRFRRDPGLDFLPDGVPIRGVAGDQQAALFGQCGFPSGEAKCTYGTGAFFLQHTGDEVDAVAASAADDASRRRVGPAAEYVLEGSVFVAGAAVQWLRDGLKLFRTAPMVEALAGQSDPEQPVMFVPGFVGLGAPHWVPEVRGVMFGLTRATTAADLGRADPGGGGVSGGGPGRRRGGAMPGAADQPARRWRHGPQRLVLAVPGGRPGPAGVCKRPRAKPRRWGRRLAGLRAGVWPDVEALRRLPRQTQRFGRGWPAERTGRSGERSGAGRCGR